MVTKTAILGGFRPCLMPFDANFWTPHLISEFPHALTKCFQPRFLEQREAGRPRRWLVVSSTHRRAEVWCIVHNDALSKVIFGLRVACAS